MELIKWDKDRKIAYFKKDGVLYKAKVIGHDLNNPIEKKILLYLFNTNKTITLSLGKIKRKQQKQQKKIDPKYIDSVSAPISGRVIKIFAEINKNIKKGTPLLSIESMKMENELSAPCDLFVKSIHIKVGDLVKQKQLLLSVGPSVD